MRPVASRLGALTADCFGPEAKRAAAISAAASKALAAPAEDDLARRLPHEVALAASDAEVRAERARRLEAATAVEKPAVEPKAEPVAKMTAKPAPKPAKKKKMKGASAR